MSGIKTVRVRIVGLIFLLPSNTLSTAIRQPCDKRQRHRQRRQSPGDKERRPAETADERSRDETRHCKADRDAKGRQHYETRLRELGRDVGGKRNGDGNAPTQAEPGRETKKRQL